VVYAEHGAINGALNQINCISATDLKPMTPREKVVILGFTRLQVHVKYKQDNAGHSEHIHPPLDMTSCQALRPKSSTELYLTLAKRDTENRPAWVGQSKGMDGLSLVVPMVTVKLFTNTAVVARFRVPLLFIASTERAICTSASSRLP
jgi:hypothetical protein